MAEVENHEDRLSTLGQIEIAPEVLQIIAGLAVSKVAGVAELEDGFVGGFAQKLGWNNVSKGIRIHLGEGHAAVDLSIVIRFGEYIPTIARQVQQVVKADIEELTGLEVIEVNVHVVGVETPEETN